MYKTQKKFWSLVQEVASKYVIDKVYWYKAFDNRDNFDIRDKINAEPVIKIR
jgi:hypothetical protein